MIWSKSCYVRVVSRTSTHAAQNLCTAHSMLLALRMIIGKRPFYPQRSHLTLIKHLRFKILRSPSVKRPNILVIGPLSKRASTNINTNIISSHHLPSSRFKTSIHIPHAEMAFSHPKATNLPSNPTPPGSRSPAHTAIPSLTLQQATTGTDVIDPRPACRYGCLKPAV